jgi:hypothetical protein
MIAAKVVTHRPFLLFAIAGGVDDEPTFTQGPAKKQNYVYRFNRLSEKSPPWKSVW